MEGAALAPPHQVAQVRYMVAALILGAAGSMIALAAFSAHTYRVGPFLMEMSILPSTSGTTELAIEPIRPTLRTGFAEAPTHAGFLTLRGKAIGIYGEAFLDEAAAAFVDPHTFATTIRDQGEDAFKWFGIRVGWLTLAGGAAGGMAIALFGMKARRIFQGALGGLILVGALGLVAWQTYDIDEFSKVQFRQAGSAAPIQSGVAPG